MIKIIGLGAGDLNQLPYGIFKLLQSAEHVFLRTKEHPVVAELELNYTSFDEVYEKYDTFSEVYDEITKTLLAASAQQDIIYAVPGHPLVAERVVQLLIESDTEIEIIGGQSFLDAMFTTLKVDPIEGFAMHDATDFKAENLALRQHTVFCQVYNGQIASNIKLPLLELIPAEYEVYLVTAAGTNAEVVKKVQLFELDFETELNNLTSVYIPPVPENLLKHELSALRATLRELRGPNGCAWDQSQTHESLKKNLIDETQELLEALDGDDDEHIVEELGDVLLQVMFHAQLGEEAGYFNIDDVIRTLNEKLIRRHPHVFGDLKASTPEEAHAIWLEMKKNEK